MHFVCYTILCGFQILFLWFHCLMTLVYLCHLKASKLEFSKNKCDLEANRLKNLRFYEICGFTKLPLLDIHLIRRWSEKIKFWLKGIMKFKPIREAPDKKLGVENDRLGPKKFFTRPKIWKSFLKVMDFCKTFWEIFDFFQKSNYNRRQS